MNKRQKGWSNNNESDNETIEKTDYLQEEEKVVVLNIIDKAEYIEHLLISKLGLNGLRESEIVGLKYYGKKAEKYGKVRYVGIQREDIDFEKSTIKVKGKGKKWRTVGVDPNTMNRLKTYIITMKIPKGKPIFNRPDEGITFTTREVRRFTKEYSKKARIGRELNFHMFRHTWAVEALFQGIDLESIRDQLGHANVIITARMYLKVAPRDRIAEFKLKLKDWRQPA